MGSKSFSTRPASVDEAFDINGTAFRLSASVPGDVLLDFLGSADDENPAGMALALRGLLDSAVHPDDLDRFKKFIRDPENNVSLDVLAEVAGYAAEKLAGSSDPTPQPGGLPSPG